MRKPRCHRTLASEDEDGEDTILTTCDRKEHEDGWHRSTLTTSLGLLLDIRWTEPVDAD
jgi:hypothetical protein